MTMLQSLQSAVRPLLRPMVVALMLVMPGIVAAKTMTIGVSIPTLDNPFWVRAQGFADHVAKELGIKLVLVAAEHREQKQLNDVQSLISRGVDALVVTPQSTASAPGLIRLADRHHIPIMIVDRYPGFPAKNDKAPYVGFIGPDDVSAGKAITNYLIEHGVTKIAALGGLPGSSVAEGRKKGLHEALKAHPNVKLLQYLGVGETQDAGYSAMQNILQAHPAGTINGVWCYNDALCLGAYQAIHQKHRQSQIVLGGMDLDPQALKLIDKHTDYIYSTGGHWMEVGFGVMIAYDKVNGHDPLKTDIRLSLLGVNGDNFAKFKKEYIDGTPPCKIKEYTLTNNPNATQQTCPLTVQ